MQQRLVPESPQFACKLGLPEASINWHSRRYFATILVSLCKNRADHIMPVYDELIETFPAHVRKPRPRYGRRFGKVLVVCGLGVLIALVIKSVWFYRPTGSTGMMLLTSCTSRIIRNPELPGEFGILLNDVDQNLRHDGFERVDKQTALDTFPKESSAKLNAYVRYRSFRPLHELRWYRKYFDDDIPMLVATATHTDRVISGRHFVHQHHCDVYLLWDFRGRSSRADAFRQVGEKYYEDAKANWQISYQGQLDQPEEEKAAEREAWRKYDEKHSKYGS